MKVLALSQSYPYPPDDGSRTLIWNLASGLARSHEVLLLTSAPQESHAAPRINQLMVESYPAAPPRSSYSAKVRRHVSCITTGTPAWIKATQSDALNDRILDASLTWRPDAAVAMENSAADLLAHVCPGVPRVLIKHSVQSKDAEEYQELRGALNPRWVYESWVTRRYEGRTLEGLARVLVLASQDGEELNRRFGCVHWKMLPTGVDLDLFPWRPDPGGFLVAFVANFGWQANEDAALWLLDYIWPAVVGRVPHSRLRLVGKNIETIRRQRSPHPSVELIGYVDDVATSLENVAVGVVPVRIGGGIRRKLLEAMSLGIPTVTTSLGMFGISAEPGRHCLVADSAEDIVDAVVRLLSEVSIRESIAAEARALVSGLGWDESVSRLEEELASIVGERPSSSDGARA